MTEAGSILPPNKHSTEYWEANCLFSPTLKTLKQRYDSSQMILIRSVPRPRGGCSTKRGGGRETKGGQTKKRWDGTPCTHTHALLSSSLLGKVFMELSGYVGMWLLRVWSLDSVKIKEEKISPPGHTTQSGLTPTNHQYLTAVTSVSSLTLKNNKSQEQIMHLDLSPAIKKSITR